MPDSGQPKERTSIKGSYRAAKKFALTSITNEQMLHTVRESGMVSTIRDLFPGLVSSQDSAKRQQVHRWVESTDAIEQSVCTSKGDHQKTRDRGDETVLPADAEEQLDFWVTDLRKKGLPVSSCMPALQSREIATELGQMTPEGSQQVAVAFSVAVREAIIEHNIAAVYNAGQTAMNYEYLPSHTISESGERTVWVRNSGVENSRMTVMLLADLSGN